MPEITYVNLQRNLASVVDRVVRDHEVFIVGRAGAKSVAIVSADELSGLIETAHLLRSPKNALRLLAALHRI
jgi:antitoxin YefM